MREVMLGITIFMLVGVLSACENRYEQTSRVQGEGDSRVHQAEVDLYDLNGVGIHVAPKSDVGEDAVLSPNASLLTSWRNRPGLRDRLRAYIENIHRILKMQRHHGMNLSAGEVAFYERSAQIARHYLELLGD